MENQEPKIKRKMATGENSKMAKNKKSKKAHCLSTRSMCCGGLPKIIWEPMNSFYDPSYVEGFPVSSYLEDLYVKCDDGSTLKLHRILVETMLSSEFLDQFPKEELPDNKIVLHMESFPKSIIKTIMKYPYTGKMEICEDEVQELLSFGIQFNLPLLVNACIDNLLETVNTGNALKISATIRNIACYTKWNQLQLFIKQNIQDILNNCREAAKKLPTDILMDIFSDDHLNMSEEELFETILEMINENHMRRRLLTTVRFSFLEPNYMVNKVVPNQFVQKQRDIKQLVAESLASASSKKKLHKPRIPTDMVLAVAGWSTNATNGPSDIIELFNHCTSTWKMKYNIKAVGPRAYHGMGVIGDNVYLFGGYDGHGYLNKTYRFNPGQNSWVEMQPMRHVRYYVAGATLGGLVYAIGGHNGHDRFRECEVYDPIQNTWTNLPPMFEVRSDAAACAYKGKIYAIGGFDGFVIHSSIESYNPVTRNWSQGPNMVTQRSGVKAVVCQDKIYAIGGFDGIERLNTVEVLDLNQPVPRWEPVASLNRQRSNFGVAVVHNKILVAGGYDGTGVTNSVEIYNPTTNIWTTLKSMTHRKSALSLVTVPMLGRPMEQAI